MGPDATESDDRIERLGLTERERPVLALLATSTADRQIGEELPISEDGECLRLAHPREVDVSSLAEAAPPLSAWASPHVGSRQGNLYLRPAARSRSHQQAAAELLGAISHADKPEAAGAGAPVSNPIRIEPAPVVGYR